MNTIPKGFVSLPAIPEVTDRFIIDSLNLPIGFDEEQLGFNIRALERVANFAHLGDVSITGYSGEQTEVSISPGNAQNGVATAFGKLAIKKARLYQAELDEEDYWFGHPNVDIKLNTAEIDSKLTSQRKSGQRGALDPTQRSTELNAALKQSLGDTLNHRFITAEALTNSLFVYGTSEVFQQITFGTDIGSPVLLGAFAVNALLRPTLFGKKPKDTMISATYGVAADRYIFTRALVATSTFVKAI